MALMAASTRFLFFSGEGGVGTTSLSCACGVALRDEPKPIASVPALSALNSDHEAAAGACRERMLAPVGATTRRYSGD